MFPRRVGVFEHSRGPILDAEPQGLRVAHTPRRGAPQGLGPRRQPPRAPRRHPARGAPPPRVVDASGGGGWLGSPPLSRRGGGRLGEIAISDCVVDAHTCLYRYPNASPGALGGSGCLSPSACLPAPRLFDRTWLRPATWGVGDNPSCCRLVSPVTFTPTTPFRVVGGGGQQDPVSTPQSTQQGTRFFRPIFCHSVIRQ